MARIKWDETGKRFYTTGVDRVAIYIKDAEGNYGKAIPFSGVSSIEENPSGGESTAIYADNLKYLELVSKEDYGLSITAYDCPKEFGVCDGVVEAAPGLRIGQQTRKRFGLVWRSNIGNDTEGNDYGYAYHIAYNCKAGVSSKSHQTINDSPEAAELSWEVTTTDEVIENYKPSAKLTIYTRDLTDEMLASLENLLFGSDDNATDGSLPSPDDLIRMLSGGDQPTPEPEPTPEPTQYAEVTPVGTENPHEEGWYDYDESRTPQYQLTEDTTVVSEKKYYEVVTSGEG